MKMGLTKMNYDLHVNSDHKWVNLGVDKMLASFVSTHSFVTLSKIQLFLHWIHQDRMVIISVKGIHRCWLTEMGRWLEKSMVGTSVDISGVEVSGWKAKLNI